MRPAGRSCPRLYYNTTTAIFLRPLCRSTCVSRHLQLRTRGFYCAKFYCTHALADSNQCIRISCWSSAEQCYLHCLRAIIFLYIASLKFRLVLPFKYWLTQVFLESRLLNGCSSSSSSSMDQNCSWLQLKVKVTDHS